MARKGAVSIQDNLDNDEEFEEYLEKHKHQVILLEVYSENFGMCTATANAIRKGKLEVGLDGVAMAKACAENITCLERFRQKSEPTFLFVRDHKVCRVMFGANGIELLRILADVIDINQHAQETGVDKETMKFELDEITPFEIAKIEEEDQLEKEMFEQVSRLRVLTRAARKRRVASRLAQLTRRMNWILFWPHNHQAHYDLYEKWDMANVSVAAKETFEMTEEMAREALYMGDVDLNDACLHALTTGEALVVLFKMYETDDRDFVQLARHILYEEIPVPKEDVPPEKQLPPIPAYERYATISKTAREVRRDRYEAKMAKLREEEEERDRLRREQERLARQEAEEKEALEKKKKEEERMARLAAGLPADPEPEELAAAEGEGEEVEEEGEEGEEGKPRKKRAAAGEGEEAEGEQVGEEQAEAEEAPPVVEEFHSDVSIEGEDYIPPGGLFVPGLYAPPNDLAKANGLKLFFPKKVVEYTNIPLETEHLPPHVLVMFPVDKRHEVMDVINAYRDEILNYGFFVGDDPENLTHVAYTIKQYDKETRLRKHLDRLAIQVSKKRSLPLLQLAGLNPTYISSDTDAGEKDCLTVFPVGYGDDYTEEESVVEEQAVEAAPPPVQAAETTEEAPPAEEVEEEELVLD